jgi:hypothetical protein
LRSACPSWIKMKVTSDASRPLTMKASPKRTLRASHDAGVLRPP